MSVMPWLRAADCPVLQADSEADPLAVRLVQRLLELSLASKGADETARLLLEEILAALRADQAVVAEAAPNWSVRWQQTRRGVRPAADSLPRNLLSDVLDREAGVEQAPQANQPAYLAACLSYVERPNRVLLVMRPREPFQVVELQYAVAAGHYLGLALERAREWDRSLEARERLQTLVAIGQQLVEERETVPLLEHIAAQAARLLHGERASIFLWDRERKQLVGRPALGLPNNELRLPEDAGIVGKVIKTGQVQQVDDVRADPDWHDRADAKTGFQTRNLLCVPLLDGAGQCLGALEVMNKPGAFAAD